MNAYHGRDSEVNYWRPHFRVSDGDDVEPKTVTMFLCRLNGNIDVIVLSPKGKEVRSYQLKFNLPGETQWRCSRSIFMAINKHQQNYEHWDDCFVDHFIVGMEEDNFKIKRIRTDERCDYRYVRMSSCSCDKTYSFFLHNRITNHSTLTISTIDCKIIHAESHRSDLNSYAEELVFHHSQDTCILAVRRSKSLQLLFISPQQEVTMSNKIEFNNVIYSFHFSLCGQFIFIQEEDSYTYSTYAVLPDQQSLKLVNQFRTSKMKNLSVLGNNGTVVVCVDNPR